MLLTISKQKLVYFVHNGISSAAKSSEIELMQHLIYVQNIWIMKIQNLFKIMNFSLTYSIKKLKLNLLQFNVLKTLNRFMFHFVVYLERRNSVEES